MLYTALFDSRISLSCRELSHGFFSDSNQKVLVGNSSEVPIYEAKMTRDLRLVYQVDCGSHVDECADVS